MVKKQLAQLENDPELHHLKRAFPSIVTGLERDVADTSLPPQEDPNKCGGEEGVANKYESRVLQGIWAAAPYLHNGSVPTLTDLLKPAEDRPASFFIGPNYDPAKVGLASDQPQDLRSELVTTDCNDVNSGRSRCGHDYGTELPEQDKVALIEYLKKL